jgi:hypothetical protein
MPSRTVGPAPRLFRSCRALAVEPLEPRRLLAAALPTDFDQYLLELANRARANPTVEAARFGIDLNEGLSPGTISSTPKQPLAFNPNLIDAARTHSQWMIDNDVFDHTGAGGSDPGDRMTAAGYSFDGTWGWGENLGWQGSFPSTPDTVATIPEVHQGLFVDEGIADRGHRKAMMRDAYREVGVGVVTGAFFSSGTNYNAVMATQDFAFRTQPSGGNSFLTGVAFNDNVTANNFYTPGEGLGGVTITAVREGDNASFSTTTWSTGGYSLRLSPGIYDVTASGGPLATPIVQNDVSIDTENVKRDFRPSAGADPTPPPPPPPPAPTEGAIHGRVRNDLNGNGRVDPGEPGLAGQQVYLDNNANGVADAGEPTATSDTLGFYDLTGLAPGTYAAKVVVPAEWRASVPEVGQRDTIVRAGKIAKAKALGLTQKVLIAGYVFLDLNANGLREETDGEIGMRGRRVFIDLNSDGLWQKNEKSVKTSPLGHFIFRDRDPGTHQVGLVFKPGFIPTTPFGGVHFVTLPTGGGIDTNLLFGDRPA